MSFLKESNLKNYAISPERWEKVRTYIKVFSWLAKKTIFLSHSHKDKELAQGCVNLLAGLGIELYVDWQDSEMPRITDRTTAEKIKNRILELDYFLVLATENALHSRWVPWEIGIADKGKSLDKIAIIPVADRHGNFEGNEYLQIYNHLQVDQLNNILVYEIGKNYPSKDIKAWISG